MSNLNYLERKKPITMLLNIYKNNSQVHTSKFNKFTNITINDKNKIKF